MPSQVDARLCVFCRRVPVDPRWRPFCSERCKLQDLGRWAGGDYRVPETRRDEADPEGENDDWRNDDT